MESTRTKEKRQAQEHMEKRSGAGDEEGTSHMGHNGDDGSRPRVGCLCCKRPTGAYTKA